MLLTVATLTVAGVLVEGRLNPPASGRGRDPVSRVVKLSGWDSLASRGAISILDASGPVRVTMFTDFECPFCRIMDSVLADVAANNPGKVSRSIVHTPLPYHEFAMPAAVAFECAVRQERGAAMHRALYLGRASFGKRDWGAFALEAGVSDSTLFRECLADEAVGVRIQAGVAMFRSLELSGTPAVVVNGWLFDPAYPDVVKKSVQSVLEGRSPKP